MYKHASNDTEEDVGTVDVIDLGPEEVRTKGEKDGGFRIRTEKDSLEK